MEQAWDGIWPCAIRKLLLVSLLWWAGLTPEKEGDVSGKAEDDYVGG